MSGHVLICSDTPGMTPSTLSRILRAPLVALPAARRLHAIFGACGTGKTRAARILGARVPDSAGEIRSASEVTIELTERDLSELDDLFAAIRSTGGTVRHIGRRPGIVDRQRARRAAEGLQGAVRSPEALLGTRWARKSDPTFLGSLRSKWPGVISW